MNKIFLILIVLLFTFPAIGQDQELPDELVLETKDDYAQYEQNVINSVNWLINTPVDSGKEKRVAVNAFLMQWLTGSPNVTIELTQEIATFMECGDCLMVFMGGWAKYALENDEFKNKLKGNLAGIESLIEFYTLNKEAMGRNKAIEKYISLKEKGKLEKHVSSKI